ncbi:MAG: sigma-70 family RNA polymerase sigma factor [Myxococcales bacterium]|nr:sigma-70 family RNA polymerase sigma factor [Myxococcales bacterium]
MNSDDAFIEEYRPLVMSIVHRLRAQLDLTTELDDLAAAGFEGLLSARSRYDASRGVQFSTFAYYRIRGAVIDQVRRLGFHSRRAWMRMKAAEGADRIAESAGESRAGRRGDLGGAVSTLDDTLSQLAASFVMSSLGHGEEDAPETPEQRLLDADRGARIRAAVAKLPERERVLIEGFYFGGRRFDRVGEELGISKSWASRLHTRALERLRKELEAPE